MFRVSAITFVCFATLISVSECGLIADRVNATENTKGIYNTFSDHAKLTWGQIETFTDESGRLPTLIEFDHVLESNSIQWGDADYSQLKTVFDLIQVPKVSYRQLIKILSTQRELLQQGIKIDYVVTNHQAESHVTQECLFALSGSQVMSSFRETGGKRGLYEERVTYDGNTMRRIVTPNGSPSSMWIQKLNSQKDFYRLENPIRMAMLLDTRKIFGVEHLQDDLELWCTRFISYESPVETEEGPCVIIGDRTHKIFLSIDRNFAVTQQVIRTLDPNLWGPTEPRISRKYTDFIEFHEGLWLPRTVRQTTIDNQGQISDTMTVTVRNYSTPQETDFKTPIPDGAAVVNRLENVHYFSDRSPSNTSSTIEQKKTSWGWLMVLNTIVLVMLVLAFMIKSFQKKRGLP